MKLAVKGISARFIPLGESPTISFDMFANLCILSALSASALAETVHGVVTFTRHGDRTTRMFPGYHLTNLGANQAFNSGQFYRNRYVVDGAPFKIAGISTDQVNPSQIWASAPNQGLLFQTANNFLQGLYPPLGQINAQLAEETLANGTEVVDPLNGYQFILINGQSANGQDAIWIKGDDFCPVHIAAQKSYAQSAAYKQTYNSTLSFYSHFNSLFEPFLGVGKVTYENAYEIFDLMNVASIHNASLSPSINRQTLDQLRYLADQWEWNNNYNVSQPARTIGGKTLIGGILKRMNETVSKKGASNKFQLFSGSYDTFISFFGLANLTTASPDFYGIPDYASTIAFEMFTTGGNATNPAAFPSNVTENLRVRFLFRNGTASSSPLTVFPLFGQTANSLSYGEFLQRMNSVAIPSVGEWCTVCGSTQDFCGVANQTYAGNKIETKSEGGSGLSNAAAGGIGAAATLVVMGIIGALAFIFMRKRKSPATTAQKSDSLSDSDLSGAGVKH